MNCYSVQEIFKLSYTGLSKESCRQPNTMNAIEKTVSVIDYLSAKEAAFTEIQRDLGVPKATLHRILQALEAHEFIEKDRVTDTYRLGLKFIYYGESVKGKTDLPCVVNDYLRGLSREIGETCCLSVLYQNTVLNLSSFEGDESALTSRLLPLSPLNCSASGKIYLTHFSDDALREYFSGGGPVKKTSNSICTYEEFLEEKQKIIESGVSRDNEEYEYGLYCMSVPLHNHLGPMDATLGVTGPKARIFMKGVDDIEARLKDIAAVISEKLIKIKYIPEY